MTNTLSATFGTPGKKHMDFSVGVKLEVKGAQAWDIRDRVFYTNQACTDRWLGDWRKKLKFRKIELWFEGFRCVYLIKRMISMRLITKKITR